MADETHRASNKEETGASPVKTGEVANSDILPEKGVHTLSIGQNGSGKTIFNTWMLERLDTSPIVIYDTKEDDTFMSLPNKSVVTNFDNVLVAADNDKIDYIVFRPPVRELADPELLDRYLYLHYQALNNVPAYIDEIYTFHKGGRSGPGLSALLTRGRSKGISTLMSTQRPRFLTNFALSEAKLFYVFKLSMRDDRKRIADIIPDYENAPSPPQYGFLFYKSGDEKYRIFNPVGMTRQEPQTYTETVQAAEQVRKSTWI